MTVINVGANPSTNQTFLLFLRPHLPLLLFMTMETQVQKTPVRDLRVTVQRSSRVFPSEETEKRSMFLSNIDQILAFNVETVHFFNANVDFPPEKATEILETALGKLLVTYDFLAGRLRFNSQEGRLEIDCNAAGAVFTAATSELHLAELGDLVYPNPAFRQLILGKPESFGVEDEPLCLLQVTSFKCGGFVMGLATNHTAFDGQAAKLFVQNLASLAAGKPLAVVPYNNREPLRARSPPIVSFPHPELVDVEIPTLSGEPQNILDTELLEAQQKDMEFKLFRLTAEDIAILKEKAKDSGRGATSFNVVTTHVWRCKALAGGDSPEKLSVVLYAVDIRPRLQPPIPAEYVGNAVLAANATATCHDLEVGPFSSLVNKVREGNLRMTDEYARSVIDWGQLHKGFPRGDMFVSSWWRLGFAEVDYPWGRPKYSCPVAHPNRDIVLFFPDMEGMNNGNGVNILVTLPGKDLENFQRLFREFLE